MRDFKILANEELFVWRRMNNLSQTEVAKRFGLHQTSISKMEKGQLLVAEKIREHIKGSELASLGMRVAVLRRRKGMSIGGAARALGIHEHRIAEMERGRRPVSDAYLELVK